MVLSLSLVSSRAAADPAADRERVRRERADAAAKLRAAEATDEELADAVDALGGAERAALGKAQQATRALQRAEADVAEAESTLSRQRRAVAERAVRAYAEQGQVQVLTGVGRPEDAARRLALAKVVQGRLVDAVDSSRAAVDDLSRRRRQQAAAARQAARSLRQVVDARSRTTKAQADLDRRIDGLRKEVDALEAEEGELSQLLAARASRAAVPPPDPPSGPIRPGGAAAPPSGGVSASGFMWPVNGRLTSPFGPRWGRMHQGQDIAAPTGTPIKAAKAGRVIKAGGAGGYGNLTLLDHGGGIVTAYGHQSRFAAGEGASVQTGQLIGYVGSTGHSTGPHLHFEVRVNGTQRNPRPYLP
ncbi:MAG: Phage lysin, 1,4-beta-N-acetylmuramidase or lysozyme [uncultured Acidimicrobiales bacterium]|uniref:Phage lysin, 1,4-beta-N-acetylmuramidase or lysozyme n=1 Tax=uncultured Acidimicrobiales bacterium TaxID=310071 RepID=A0A6J4I8X9_9ACTN|nr:MAG: Phage lysin, 1,4-beta-N-acetylmuramidase or lysozyme [uncultured Acidimicrobiales bacterium]